MIHTSLTRLSLDRHALRALAWLFVSLVALNAVYFVLRATNPIIQADGWNYLEVFLRKAINGTLGIADLFGKRSGDDHAQPLFKLLMLLNWRYFDLDFVVDALVGYLAAVACALIYWKVITSNNFCGTSEARRYLAWTTICALLFSLNSIGIWIWSLVTLENVTTLIILVFIISVWRAHRNDRYAALIISTLFLGISSDDSALIAVFAVATALFLARLSDPEQRLQSSWKTLVLVGTCLLSIRFGYAYLSTSQGPHTPIDIPVLYDRFKEGGWWQWIFQPLVLPVYYENPLGPTRRIAWLAIQLVMAATLATAHFLFWRKALCGKYNLAVFIAVTTMLLTYAWIAGIIVWRVTRFSNDYLLQPRYVLYYTGQLIALIMMWACSENIPQRANSRMQFAFAWAPVVGCLFLLGAQIPQSLSAWNMRKYVAAYYVKTAWQINNIAVDPAHATDCALVEPCVAPTKTRRELTQLLSVNRLNLYSPNVQRRHRYLPVLLAVPNERRDLDPSTEDPSNK